MITANMMKRMQQITQAPDWSGLHMLASFAVEEDEKERKDSLTKKRVREEEEEIVIRRKKRSPRNRRLREYPNQEITSHNAASAAVVLNGGVPAAGEDINQDQERKLVFKKKLTKTDMSTHHSRLLIPLRGLVDTFLTPEEERRLLMREEGYKVPAKLIGPYGKEYQVSLRMQTLGEGSLCYTIGKPWNDITKKNGLAKGMKVELRAWRRNGTDLWLSLVRG